MSYEITSCSCYIVICYLTARIFVYHSLPSRMKWDHQKRRRCLSPKLFSLGYLSLSSFEYLLPDGVPDIREDKTLSKCPSLHKILKKRHIDRTSISTNFVQQLDEATYVLCTKRYRRYRIIAITKISRKYPKYIRRISEIYPENVAESSP